MSKMNSDYIICMDVSGDIDPEVAKEYGIRFLPMEYSIGGEMRKCVTMEENTIIRQFYNGQRNGDLTKTTQISPFLYEEYIGPMLAEGKDVLYLCLSSGLSSTFQSACMAKENLKEKYPDNSFYPIDSLAATGGMGLLTERAIRNREAGMSIEENYKDVVAATHHIRHWFVVQDLMYLKRGGRVSAATAVVGTALNVKPILKIDEIGKLVTWDKKRGNKAAVKSMVSKFVETHDPETEDVIYIMDADEDDLGSQLKEEVLKLYPQATVRRASLSPIIGAHTGPGMAAIIHMGR